MRKAFYTWVVMVGLLGATQAQATASYANRNLGVGVSFFKVLGETVGVDWGLPISLEGGIYLDSGFEVFVQPQFMILSVTTGAMTPDGRGSIFGFGGHLGARYLFSQESIRPYLALHVSVLGLAATVTRVFVGPGVSAGSDFFVSDSISLGARLTFDVFWALNVNPSFGLGGGLYATTYF